MDESLDEKFFWRYGRNKPIKVKGGVKAQTKKFGNVWWAQKWLEAIEKFGPEKRVARGRSYARKGQVVELKIEPGQISAIVQGSRDEPYQIQIPLERIRPEAENDILYELQTQPIYAATLLTGEVPPQVEDLFRKYDAPLFPTKAEGREASCSCPDSSIICKHIAAIYYLISVELERDPFLLLLLRGIRKEQLTVQKQHGLFVPEQIEPLPTDPQQFWKSPRLKPVPLETSSGKDDRPAILRRLGPFPMWRGEADFAKTMDAIYEAARRSEDRGDKGNEI